MNADGPQDPLATVDRLALYLAVYAERFGAEPERLTEYATSYVQLEAAA